MREEEKRGEKEVALSASLPPRAQDSKSSAVRFSGLGTLVQSSFLVQSSVVSDYERKRISRQGLQPQTLPGRTRSFKPFARDGSGL